MCGSTEIALLGNYPENSDQVSNIIFEDNVAQCIKRV
jgi:hypothetical protein